MHPEEAAAPLLRPIPVEGRGNHLRGRALRRDELARRRCLAVAVVVEIEALAQTEAGVEREGSRNALGKR